MGHTPSITWEYSLVSLVLTGRNPYKYYSEAKGKVKGIGRSAGSGKGGDAGRSGL